VPQGVINPTHGSNYKGELPYLLHSLQLS
jgi:hypothetical protein